MTGIVVKRVVKYKKRGARTDVVLARVFAAWVRDVPGSSLLSQPAQSVVVPTASSLQQDLTST
jgi:hypothetical protein